MAVVVPGWCGLYPGSGSAFPVFVGARNWQFRAGFSCRNPLH
jgi:hypothetical protein